VCRREPCAVDQARANGADHSDDPAGELDLFRHLRSERSGIIHHHRIAGEHLAGDPAEQRHAGPDDDREIIEDDHDEIGATDDRRNAHAKAEDQEREIAVGYRCHGDDVVEAHHHVGNRDQFHGSP
jgi:hypothetical protein